MSIKKSQLGLDFERISVELSRDRSPLAQRSARRAASEHTRRLSFSHEPRFAILAHVPAVRSRCSLRQRTAISAQSSMDVSCACGAVKFKTPTPAPLKLYHCHCLDCRKQSASAFGTSAVFPFFRLPENPSITHYDRTCDSGRRQRCFFCRGCGSRMMHLYILEEGTPDIVTIKGGLIEGLDWTGGTHLFCRSAVVPIPEGAETFEAEPTD